MAPEAGPAAVARPARAPSRAGPRPRRAVPDPRAQAVRGPRRGGPVAHRAQRGHDPRGGRDHLPRRPGRARDRPPGRRRRRRRAGPVPARDVPPDHPGVGAPDLHPARPQPGTDRPARRPVHGPRAELRQPVRARPGQRPALRDARGLPQLREARVHDAAPPPLGRDGLRAGRHPGQQAPPRHGLFAHQVQRQAVHGLGHPPDARRRHRRAGEDRVQRPRRRTTSTTTPSSSA